MTPVESRTELPADVTSAGLARRHVRAACEQAGQEELVDDALLLVTELVTNAVVHAGTAVDLVVTAGPEGVRVEVADARPGGLPSPTAAVDESREGGRGLFLLDQLATTWGSTHTRTGKALWFALGAGAAEPARPAVSAAAPPADRDLDLADVEWLLALGDRTAQLGSGVVVNETLHRLVEGLHAGWAVLVGPGSRGTWRIDGHVGSVPDELSAEELRRSAPHDVRWTTWEDALVLLLGRRGEASGAVVLGGVAGLDAPRRALARLAADGLDVLLQEERSRADLLRDRGSLALLAEASEMFAGALDVTLATTLLCQLVVPRFGRWAAVYGAAGRGATLLAAVHADEQQGAELRVRLSSGPARELAGGLVAARGLPSPRLVAPAEVPAALASGTDGVLAIPLSTRSRSLGVLLLARPEAAASDDVPVLVDLSRRAALAVEGARLYEERSAVAQALQASLLPPALPQVDGLVFGARYAAAGEGNEVGGDFYDVFPVGDGRWAVAIGDVCGKGPEAATITGLARNVLRLMVEEGRTPEQAFQRLNAAILDMGDRGRFLTAALALLEPHESGSRVLLATAGHPPPAVVSASGAVRFEGTGGTLLGVTPDVEIALTALDLPIGDHLVLYTDGVTERRDGARWFGESTLRSSLRDAAGRTPDQVAGHLELQVRRFGPAAASDDLAVLVVGAVPLREKVAAPTPSVVVGV